MLYYRPMAETVQLDHTAALTRFGYALADPTRTAILLALRESSAYPADLAGALGVSRQVVSNQLACLRGCGLVTATPEGRRTSYALADPHLAPTLNNLMQLVVTVDPTCCSSQRCTC